MELLETQDPEKQRLIATSDRHKYELEKEVKEISDSTERVVKNALIIGGALAITYLVVSSLNSSNKKKKKAKAKQTGAVTTEDESDVEKASTSFAPSFLSQVGERLATQATALLLGLAKDKLAEYLNRKQPNENS